MKASVEGGDKMRIFQNFLKSIPKWNQEIINDETSRIIEDSKCCVIGKCKHSYHYNCINTWLKSNYKCPLCNQKWEFIKK